MKKPRYSLVVELDTADHGTDGTTGPERVPEWKKAAETVASELNADVYLFSGRINRPSDSQLFDALASRSRRPDIFFTLVTSGGDADAGYRIARALQDYYDRVIIFIPGYCKSAGTLIATGSHELVISDQGELGPLDVQMQKADELWEMSSGLTVIEAINTLEETAFRMLEDGFLRIKARSGGQITFRTATDVSVAMVTRLLEPIYEQIDPMHIGEAGRAMNVGRDYGERLAAVGTNLRPNGIYDLVALFSSHGFVIDRDEARVYFHRVRAPSEEEEAFAVSLGDIGRMPVEADQPISGYLSDEFSAMESEVEEEHGAGAPTQQMDGGANGHAGEEVPRVGGDPADSRKPVGREEG